VFCTPIRIYHIDVCSRYSWNCTAAVGKLGPTAIQDVSQLRPVNQRFPVPQTVIIDDRTGQDSGVPLPVAIVAALNAARLPTTAVARNQPAGNNTTAGTLNANLDQQQYFADALTKAILPAFVQQGQPFVLVYWSPGWPSIRIHRIRPVAASMLPAE